MAPLIRAGVMIANFPWNIARDVLGDSVRDHRVHPHEEHEVAVPPDDPAQDPFPEGERVADRRPKHPDDRQRNEAMHHRPKDVLGAD